MAENFIPPSPELSREDRYESLLPQIKALVSGEPDMVANTANITAVLKEAMGFFWTGFYFVNGNELVLGPFQGPVACTRIAYGRGVCGTAWKEKKSIIVDDVDAFPGHIACSAFSRSEIVIPAFRNGEVFLVLDIDSDKLNDFNETDSKYLSQIIQIIEEL